MQTNVKRGQTQIGVQADNLSSFGKGAVTDSDCSWVVVDIHRLQTALKREFLQMKRLQQLIMLSDKGNVDKTNDSAVDKSAAIREKVVQTAALIEVLEKAVTSKKVDVSIAMKLGILCICIIYVFAY